PRQQGKLARGTEDEEHAMSAKFNSEITVIGIDIGKNSFHIVGLDRRGAIVLRSEVVPRPSGNTARQPAAVSDRHGGLRRRPPSEPQAHIAWSRRSADASQICPSLLERAEERLPRYRGNCRGGAAPTMKFVATDPAAI